MSETDSSATARSPEQCKQPKLPFWQVWNVSLGFLGVQFGFALQNANASRILSDLGADLHSLSLFWIVAPLMGLIVQPIVGSASDRTWNRFGRRNPFILFGAIAAALGMAFMPNAGIAVAIIAPIVFGGVMLALMDAAFNVTMQPFRALVSDMVPPEQRTLGYSIQSLLINIGAVCGSMLPFVLTNVIGLENTSKAGEVAPSVIWAFYLGASVLLGSVLWTVFRTREYAPAEYNAYKGLDSEQLAREQAERKSLSQRLKGFFKLLFSMPVTMRQLALVQFFSWFALFIMWVYTTPAITQYVWGVDAKWFDPDYLHSVGEIPPAIAAAKGAAGDWVGILFAAYSLFAALFSIVLAKVAGTIGRKPTYALSLALGGLCLISFLLFQGGEQTHVNLLITEVTVPAGALGLLLPMIGVGIAWAAILAMPYSILSEALPADKTGVYMGIFNFTIAAPQIVSALVAGPLLAGVFDNQAINILVLAGVFMFLGAVSVFFVRERSDEGALDTEAATV
ncbi:MFS transporter [Microbulbifer sp. SAOS-129_SWC]|uniref:MFS transporter n=1 Tax=Microbulbifer sp. SAOS-129_SWC TaxID=3145235 RepID=UPI003217CE15